MSLAQWFTEFTNGTDAVRFRREVNGKEDWRTDVKPSDVFDMEERIKEWGETHLEVLEEVSNELARLLTSPDTGDNKAAFSKLNKLLERVENHCKKHRTSASSANCTTVEALKAFLKEDKDRKWAVCSFAFTAYSKSAPPSLGVIEQLSNGDFSVEVECRHFMTKKLEARRIVNVKPDGTPYEP